MGKSILQWRDLRSELSETMAILGMPSMIIIHLGGNDLQHVSYFKLVDCVRKDFSQLSRQYPDIKFVWSEVLPKLSWLMTPLDKTRLQFNSTVSSIADKCGFGVITHEGIEQRLNTSYRKRIGAGITDMELDIFNTKIKDYLTATL